MTHAFKTNQNLDFRSGYEEREQDLVDLFTETFTASEGADEGRAIGDFVRDLIETTPTHDLFVWSAYQGDILVGSIFLSRIIFASDQRRVFILSPVAVKPDAQRCGVGQKLINHGLNSLRENGVDFVFTYGDPNYYAKTGFRPISEEFAQAPMALSFPEGWIGQSLNGDAKVPFIGPSECVKALRNPELW